MIGRITTNFWICILIIGFSRYTYILVSNLKVQKQFDDSTNSCFLEYP